VHLTQNACTTAPAGTISRETGSIGNGLDDEDGIDIEVMPKLPPNLGSACRWIPPLFHDARHHRSPAETPPDQYLRLPLQQPAVL